MSVPIWAKVRHTSCRLTGPSKFGLYSALVKAYHVHVWLGFRSADGQGHDAEWYGYRERKLVESGQSP